MNYNKECECCGNIVTAYTHSLNKPLVEALRKLVDHYESKKTACLLQTDINISKNQYNNFQKLQYFKLATRNKDGWFPTGLGTDFIEGVAMVKNPVATFGKEILSDDHEAWNTHLSMRESVGVQDIDIFSWKRKEEYQLEKHVPNTLF